MKTLYNIIWTSIAFLISSLIAGQVLMWGQGDTLMASIKWGFMYVLYGCGIPQALKGEWPEIIAVIIQFSVAAIVFFALGKTQNVTQK